MPFHIYTKYRIWSRLTCLFVWCRNRYGNGIDSHAILHQYKMRLSNSYIHNLWYLYPKYLHPMHHKNWEGADICVNRAYIYTKVSVRCSGGQEFLGHFDTRKHCAGVHFSRKLEPSLLGSRKHENARLDATLRSRKLEKTGLEATSWSRKLEKTRLEATWTSRKPEKTWLQATSRSRRLEKTRVQATSRSRRL
jgi:hypothetical protein